MGDIASSVANGRRTGLEAEDALSSMKLGMGGTGGGGEAIVGLGGGERYVWASESERELLLRETVRREVGEAGRTVEYQLGESGLRDPYDLFIRMDFLGEEMGLSDGVWMLGGGK